MPYGPPLYGIFWGHIFCKYWGWGWSELFSTVSSLSSLLPDHVSEKGRIWFRRARFQTPSSVSSLALTGFWGESSVSSFQPLIIFVRQRDLTEFVAELSNITLETIFCPFPSVLFSIFLKNIKRRCLGDCSYSFQGQPLNLTFSTVTVPLFCINNIVTGNVSPSTSNSFRVA